MVSSLINANNKTYLKSIDLVKIGDYFVEKPETLDPLVVEVKLDVELVEVGDAGEDDAHTGVGLTVEVL
jgi:hypothetical protein